MSSTSSGSRTIDLLFMISVGISADAIIVTGASVLAHVLNMFLFGCSTNSTSLNLLSSFLLFVLLAFDSVSCMSCSLDFF